jgi:RNA polymerase-binding transcription factor DksA
MRFVMATPSQALHREEQRDAAHPALSPLTSGQEATLRTRLLTELAEQNTRFEQHFATLDELTAKSSEDTTGRERAMAALRLYGARVAIEEIDDALVRIDDGRYGTCQSCRQPIPFKRLESVPQARFCAACPAPASPTAGRAAGPRLGSSRDDRAEARHSKRLPRDLDESGSHTSEVTRGNAITQ